MKYQVWMAWHGWMYIGYSFFTGCRGFEQVGLRPEKTTTTTTTTTKTKTKTNKNKQTNKQNHELYIVELPYYMRGGGLY